MSKLSTLFAAVLLVSTAAMAAPPSSFTENFNNLAVGTYAGSSNLIVRTGGSMINVVTDGTNKYLSWAPAVDEHLAIVGTYNDAADYDFDLSFKMSATSGAGNQGFQYGWENVNPADSSISEHQSHVGRDVASGGLHFDWPDEFYSVNNLTSSTQWANVRVMKKVQTLYVKMWAPGDAEPTDWMSSKYLVDFWQSGTKGIGAPAPAGIPTEGGLRFKWSNGLLLDDVNFATLAIVRGDATGDDMVDVGDLGVLGANYGKVATPGGRSIGDFNGDHSVDVGDLGILGANYGLGTAGAVPEPATLSLLALGVVGLIRRRNA